MRKQLTAVLAVAALAPLALAAPAAAAPGNGAQRFSERECFNEDPPGEPPFSGCFNVQGRSNVHETPSGHFHVNLKITQTFTFTSEDRTVSGTSSGKFNLLLKEGQQQVFHDRGRFTNDFDGITCSGSYRFMVVKGELKRDLFSFSCDGELPEPEPEPEPES